MRKRLLLALAFILPLVAMAQTQAQQQVPLTDRPIITPVIDDPDIIGHTYEMLVPQWAAAIHLPGVDLMLTLLGVEMAVFCIFLVIRYRADGGLSGPMTALMTKMFVVSFFLTLAVHGQVWMGWIMNALPDVARKATGMPALTAGEIIAQGVRITGILWHTALTETGLTAIVTGLAYIVCGFLIVLAFAVLAIDLLMADVMGWMVLGCAVIMLYLGTSRWTVGYTERYFSTAISIGIRKFILYFMVSAGWSLTNTWVTKAKLAPTAANGLELALLIVIGALIFVVLCVSVNHVMASMLTGAMGFGHGDFAATVAPAIGAAVSAGMLTGAVAMKSAGVAAGALGKSGGSAAKTTITTPSGWTGSTKTPQATPPSGGGNGGGGFRGNGGGVRVAAMNGMRSAVSASTSGRGGGAAPPRLNGFDH